MRNIRSILILIGLFTIFAIFIGTSSAENLTVNSGNTNQSFTNSSSDGSAVTSTVTTKSINTPINEIWLFVIVFILSFIVTYLKCEGYMCSIKYSLLISIIMAVIYSIITFILMKSTLSPGFEGILAISLLIMTAIPSIIIGLLGSLIAVSLKKIRKK